MVTAGPTLSFDVDVTAGDGRCILQLTRYPVTVESGEIFVDVEKRG